MASDPYLEEDSRVLTPEAFDFVLRNELKRAVRSQNFLTLLVVDPTPGAINGERTKFARAVARLISREVRETDQLEGSWISIAALREQVAEGANFETWSSLLIPHLETLIHDVRSAG